MLAAVKRHTHGPPVHDAGHPRGADRASGDMERARMQHIKPVLPAV